MISVDEARTRILAGLRPTAAEILPLADAWGRVTAAAVTARLTQPPRDISAMDGFAVSAADAHIGAVLTLRGAAPAGHPWDGTLGAGEALRIFTGSIFPAGADAVLLQEDATVENLGQALLNLYDDHVVRGQLGRIFARIHEALRQGSAARAAEVVLGQLARGRA